MGGKKEPSKAAVAKEQKPFLQDVRQQAQKLFQQGPPTIQDLDAQIAAGIAPIEQRYTEAILPQLTSAAEQAGAYGGSGLATQRAAAGRDFTSQAVQAALPLRNQLMNQALATQWAPLANYAAALGGPIVLGTGSTVGQPSQLSNTLTGALGGAGTGYSVGGGWGALAGGIVGGAAGSQQ